MPFGNFRLQYGRDLGEFRVVPRQYLLGLLGNRERHNDAVVDGKARIWSPISSSIVSSIAWLSMYMSFAQPCSGLSASRASSGNLCITLSPTVEAA